MGSSCEKSDKQSVGGKSQIFLPFFIRSRILHSMEIAEELKGSPPNTPEVHCVTINHYGNTSTQGWVSAFLQNLYREDLFYADKFFTVWSMTNTGPGKEGFENFSERFRRIYPGYLLDNEMHIRAKPGTKVVNLVDLVDLLRSKDRHLWEQAGWIYNNELKYLDGSPNNSNKIAFASFPRSGNTFLRKYFEMLSGIQTGADNTLHINVTLQMMGMKGEDIADDTVWVVKSHSPWCMPFAPVFHANKMVCIVRNPMDVIVSWLDLIATASHSTKAPFDYEKDYPEWWDWWIRDCSKLYAKWFETVMRDANLRKVPVLWIRYEDLCENPEPHLKNIMRFMINLKDLSGTNAERRVQEVLSQGKEATQVYSLKANTLRFNAQGKRYSAAQRELVGKNCERMVHFFGYAINEAADPDNSTGFYPLQSPDVEMMKQHKGYLQQNENMVDWVCSMTQDEASEIQYQLTDQSKEVNLMSFENSDKACRPMKDYSEKLLYGKSFTDFSSFKNDFRQVTEVKSVDELDRVLETDKLVVVDFFAKWCPPCAQMTPVVDKLCAEMKNVLFAKIDVDEAGDLADSLNVEKMPTFVLFKNGIKVGEYVGSEEVHLRKTIQSHLQ